YAVPYDYQQAAAEQYIRNVEASNWFYLSDEGDKRALTLFSVQLVFAVPSIITAGMASGADVGLIYPMATIAAAEEAPLTGTAVATTQLALGEASSSTGMVEESDLPGLLARVPGDARLAGQNVVVGHGPSDAAVAIGYARDIPKFNGMFPEQVPATPG